MTIHQYLTALRLRASLEPLTDSSTPLARLAIDLGFSSQSHFTRQFRRAFGRTPGSVRRATSTTDLREMSKKLQDPPTS